MHELSIAENILSLIEDKKKELGDSKITSIGLRIGTLAGIESDSLRFAMEVLVKGTQLEGIDLSIERLSPMIGCLDCGLESEVAELNFSCRKCGSSNVRIIRGYELELSFIEVDTANGG